MGIVEVRTRDTLTRDELLAAFRNVAAILPPLEEMVARSDALAERAAKNEIRVDDKNRFSLLRGFFSFSFWSIVLMGCFLSADPGGHPSVALCAFLGLCITIAIKLINNAVRRATLKGRNAKLMAEAEKVNSECVAYKMENSAAFIFLPPDYRQPWQIRKMHEYFENYRVDTMKDAVNLLESECAGQQAGASVP